MQDNIIVKPSVEKQFDRFLRQAGRRRKAGARPPCMAGHLPAPAGREGSDGNHPRRVPAADEQGSDAAVLLRHKRAAQHHERRQGLFRMEQKGRPVKTTSGRCRISI